ncbi:endogenous retrovirus group 3 member 1 Env polyprotein [Pogoniulus pusillus]|uniref:endogenous retrovirus group 3 member 1 Env polyprotein n=1 Tax=Pogoniulus pusillus TaxID=488313 RepID=UPI0030B95953
MALTGPLLCIFGLSLLALGQAQNCSDCITATRRGKTVSQTLVYHTIYECNGQRLDSCYHNQTEYARCNEKGKIICYDPKEVPYLWWVEIRANDGKGKLLGRSQTTTNRSQPLWVTFDACQAIDNDGASTCGNMGWRRYYSRQEKYICPEDPGQCRQYRNSPVYVVEAPWVPIQERAQYYCGETGWNCVCWATWKKGPNSCVGLRAGVKRGIPSANCTAETCNPVNLTIYDIEKWEKAKYTRYGVRIAGKGSDPGVILDVKVLQKSREGKSQHLVFHSFYHEIESGVKYEIPTVAKNLFVNLAENIAKSLNVTNCYVCGGTNQGDRWPWESMEANISDPNTWKVERGNRKQQWVLQTSIIGRSCWQRLGDGKFVGNLECEGGYEWNETKNTWERWGTPLEMPFQLRNWTNGSTIVNGWPAPGGYYWICGKVAYALLPKNWVGSCVLGTIRPSFFLLPISKGEKLGIQLYTETDELRRAKRDLQIGNWKDNEWPPERIIAYYDPATWAEDGSWGYRTPIYMLNRIIRLQAVVEIIVNKTGDALNLIAKQNTQMRTAIYQNRLALDYLLAHEGGVCGKFNLTNCCLGIDEEGNAVNQLVKEMKKIAHVPVQTWNGVNLGNWWNNLGVSNWLTKLALVGGGVLIVILIVPCLIPCFIRLITMVVQGMQVTLVPHNPEEKTKPQPIMIVQAIKERRKDGELNSLEQVIARFEAKTRINLIKKQMGDCDKYIESYV